MNDKFLYTPTLSFRKKLEKVKGENPEGYERIRSVIDRLLENPANGDGKMHGHYNGRMKKYVGRKDYRLIYHWCELCRKENKRLENKCDNCHTIPDRSVIFFDLYHKKDAARYKRIQR